MWLAVTSLSFDISVLELLWTLARGFTVVVHGGASRAAHRAPGAAKAAPQPPFAPPRARRQLQFSLFYFSSDEGQEPGDRYRLLLEGAALRRSRGLHRRLDAGAPLPCVRRPLSESVGHQRRDRRDHHAVSTFARAASCFRCTIPRASPRSGRSSTTCRGAASASPSPRAGSRTTSSCSPRTIATRRP